MITSRAQLAWQISRLQKKAAPGIPDAALANAFVNGLERESHARADHTKIIVWAVHEIPTEITDPADVRS